MINGGGLEMQCCQGIPEGLEAASRLSLTIYRLMCGVQQLLLCMLAVCFLLALPAWAGKFKPEDYPLRVHIVERNGVRHYYHAGYCAGGAQLDKVDGLGAANPFENRQPLGFWRLGTKARSMIFCSTGV